MPAAQVEAPLIAQCLANLECRVSDIKLVNKYNMFILEVVKAWIDPTQKTAGPSITRVTANSWWMANC